MLISQGDKDGRMMRDGGPTAVQDAIRKAWAIARAILAGTWVAAQTIGGSALASDSCAYDFPLDSNPTPITSRDICNFHQVDAQFFRGGRPRPGAFPKLAGLGIRTIINLEEAEYAETEKVRVDNLNMGLLPDRKIDFLSFPIGPEEIDETGISHERLRELFSLIRDAKRPIFIHC